MIPDDVHYLRGCWAFQLMILAVSPLSLINIYPYFSWVVTPCLVLACASLETKNKFGEWSRVAYIIYLILASIVAFLGGEFIGLTWFLKEKYLVIFTMGFLVYLILTYGEYLKIKIKEGQ